MNTLLLISQDPPPYVRSLHVRRFPSLGWIAYLPPVHGRADAKEIGFIYASAPNLQAVLDWARGKGISVGVEAMQSGDTNGMDTLLQEIAKWEKQKAGT